MKPADRNLKEDPNTEDQLKAGYGESFPDFRAKGIGTWKHGYPKSQQTGSDVDPIPNGTNAAPIFRGDD